MFACLRTIPPYPQPAGGDRIDPGLEFGTPDCPYDDLDLGDLLHDLGDAPDEGGEVLGAHLLHGRGVQDERPGCLPNPRLPATSRAASAAATRKLTISPGVSFVNERPTPPCLIVRLPFAWRVMLSMFLTPKPVASRIKLVLTSARTSFCKSLNMSFVTFPARSGGNYRHAELGAVQTALEVRPIFFQLPFEFLQASGDVIGLPLVRNLGPIPFGLEPLHRGGGGGLFKLP